MGRRSEPRGENERGAERRGEGCAERGTERGEERPGTGRRPTGYRAPRREVSAGGVVVRRMGGVVHVLLIRDPYDNWGLPKGHLEGGEDPPAAAVREVMEETGLAGRIIGPGLGTIDWRFRMRGKPVHKLCHFYLMHSPSGDPVPLREEGITECRWLPMEEAIRNITYDNARTVLHNARHFLDEVGEGIWSR